MKAPDLVRLRLVERLFTACDAPIHFLEVCPDGIPADLSEDIRDQGHAFATPGLDIFRFESPA
ncbi:MAG: hypothetical protein ABL973_12440 [Micropepsaceae bacterium]